MNTSTTSAKRAKTQHQTDAMAYEIDACDPVYLRELDLPFTGYTYADAPLELLEQSNYLKLCDAYSYKNSVNMMGFDGVYVTPDSTVRLVQFKHRNHTLTADDIGSFMLSTHSLRKMVPDMPRTLLVSSGAMGPMIQRAAECFQFDMLQIPAREPRASLARQHMKTANVVAKQKMVMRPHQIRFAAQYMQNCKSPFLLSCPTGTGKTLAALQLVEHYKVIVIVENTQAMCSQMAATAQQYCVDNDIAAECSIFDSENSMSDSVLLRKSDKRQIFVVTYKSADRAAEILQKRNDIAETLVIFDEAHHLTLARCGKMYSLTPAPLLMTATPELEEEITDDMTDDNRFIMSINDAVAQGLILPVNYIVPLTVLTDMPTEAQFIGTAMMMKGKMHGMAFMSTVKDCDEMAKLFTAEIQKYGLTGIAKTVSSKTKQTERDELVLWVQKPEHGVRKLLLSCQVFNEGVDLPAVDFIYMKNTNSAVTSQQRIGRSTRVLVDKLAPVIALGSPSADVSVLHDKHGAKPVIQVMTVDITKTDHAAEQVAAEKATLAYERKIVDAVETEFKSQVEAWGIFKAHLIRTTGKGVMQKTQSTLAEHGVENAGKFMFDLQKRYRYGSLSAEHAELCRAAGMTLETTRTQNKTLTADQRFEVITAYKDTDIKRSTTVQFNEQEVKLGEIVNTLRKTKKNLSQQEIKKYDDIGFVWNADDDKWDKQYELLLKTIRKKGKTTSETNIGKWIGNQRSAKDTMSQERREKLESIPNWLWKGSYKY